jgi:redox-sensing transcriptional repressor
MSVLPVPHAMINGPRSKERTRRSSIRTATGSKTQGSGRPRHPGLMAWHQPSSRLALWRELFQKRKGAMGGGSLDGRVASRLSRYLQVLTQAKKMGKERISSQEISDYTNINATQIRRDLSGFGKFGKRGVGYSVDSLLGEIGKILRTQGQHNIALIGAGRLGQAIASSPIFAEHGINIAAIFDRDPDIIGRQIGSNSGSVLDVETLADVVRDQNIIVGVIAVPAESAQQAADKLVDAGVRIIFNYSEALLDVPHDAQVHTSNPAELLHALYYFHLA